MCLQPAGTNFFFTMQERQRALVVSSTILMDLRSCAIFVCVQIGTEEHLYDECDNMHGCILTSSGLEATSCGLREVICAASRGASIYMEDTCC